MSQIRDGILIADAATEAPVAGPRRAIQGGPQSSPGSGR
jgi:hypothetical protein